MCIYNLFDTLPQKDVKTDCSLIAEFNVVFFGINCVHLLWLISLLSCHRIQFGSVLFLFIAISQVLYIVYSYCLEFVHLQIFEGKCRREKLILQYSNHSLMSSFTYNYVCIIKS